MSYLNFEISEARETAAAVPLPLWQQGKPAWSLAKAAILVTAASNLTHLTVTLQEVS